MFFLISTIQRVYWLEQMLLVVNLVYMRRWESESQALSIRAASEHAPANQSPSSATSSFSDMSTQYGLIGLSVSLSLCRPVNDHKNMISGDANQSLFEKRHALHFHGVLWKQFECVFGLQINLGRPKTGGKVSVLNYFLRNCVDYVVHDAILEATNDLENTGRYCGLCEEAGTHRSITPIQAINEKRFCSSVHQPITSLQVACLNDVVLSCLNCRAGHIHDQYNFLPFVPCSLSLYQLILKRLKKLFEEVENTCLCQIVHCFSV